MTRHDAPAVAGQGPGTASAVPACSAGSGSGSSAGTSSASEPPPVQSVAMSFFSHLGELRRRLIWSMVALAVATLVCFHFAPDLFAILRQPLAGLTSERMIVLSPLELFVTHLKLAVVAGLFVSSPWLLTQAWLFIAPGLYREEKKWLIPFAGLGSIFFVSGGLFAFYIVLPYGFAYLAAMVPESIEAQYSVALYFSLVLRLVLAFAAVFELPLIMWILAAAGIVSPKSMAGFRKYWIVVAATLAAILTPPDPLTQIMMAVPLVIFFEVGILGARLLSRRHSRTASAAAA